MTLAQIMTLALRQLDEDPEDISEYDETFKIYANLGYQIAVTEYAKPRDIRQYRSGSDGTIPLDSDVRRVVELRQRLNGDKIRRNVMFDVSPISGSVLTAYPEAEFIAVCEIMPPSLEVDTDEPVCIPQEAHPALADYICYRHLSNGNMAKQSRAQYYQQQFYQAMQRIRPEGMGSVTTFKNLYTASDVRYVR